MVASTYVSALLSSYHASTYPRRTRPSPETGGSGGAGPRTTPVIRIRSRPVRPPPGRDRRGSRGPALDAGSGIAGVRVSVVVRRRSEGSDGPLEPASATIERRGVREPRCDGGGGRDWRNGEGAERFTGLAAVRSRPAIAVSSGDRDKPADPIVSSYSQRKYSVAEVRKHRRRGRPRPPSPGDGYRTVVEAVAIG